MGTILLGYRPQKKVNVLLSVQPVHSLDVISQITGVRLQNPSSKCTLRVLKFILLILLQRFLFELLLGADANMRMVRRKVSSETSDPTLSPGWAYYCETTKYKDHLDSIGDQKDTVSTPFDSVLDG